MKTYLLAVLACVIALPIAWKLDAPSSCFLLAAMASSLYGGRGPGYLTALVSSILFDLFFLLPRFHFFHSHESYLRLAVFIAAMVLATELIAARRLAEESLRQTQAKLAQATQIATISEFSASVIHEISQPLSAMVANGQTCVRWLSTDPPNLANAQSAAERIVRDGKDAGGIIQGLRSLFRRSPPEKTPFDLRPIVTEVVSLIRGRAEREKITVEVQLPKDLPKIIGDRLQLQQVLMNLVLNGMESMRTVTDRPKTLEIHSREQDGMVLTEIRDQGVGIADFEKVFDAFFTTKEDGMGMGLSICKSIIEAHEGRLWGSPGSMTGTVFSFAIPCATEERE
ncbi:sensor histidine kinase [Tunturibacter empetritectus]|uniref:histidine kinase n=2 Tax=Tunturiibacter empetritectus TaxID=3069691 RepID=A0A7W8IKK2_9BACT|nr:PAS domain-containing sensor histidine kinase [Edaphobacter lichenicola]MBB5318111.1 C4-dicarboxylate-specific signal transduction histidine kinase [Edaphobacter lichenicola]